MKTLGYYNGKFDEIENMTVPMNDRVCWFGDGVYDAGPCRNYHIFAINEHIDRFFNSAGLLDIVMPCSKAELKELLEDLVKKLDTDEQFVYFQLTRGGTGLRDHIYPRDEEGKAIPGNLWVTLKPGRFPNPAKPIRCITAEDTRFFHCNIKSLNLIPAVAYSERAHQAGCTEAILYRPGGRVTECAHSNVSILKDGKLYTAPTDELILPGITRAHLIKAAKTLNVPVSETPYTLDTLRKADEIFVTSSSKMAMLVSELDGEPVGGKDPELANAIKDELYRDYLADTE